MTRYLWSVLLESWHTSQSVGAVITTDFGAWASLTLLQINCVTLGKTPPSLGLFHQEVKVRLAQWVSIFSKTPECPGKLVNNAYHMLHVPQTFWCRRSGEAKESIFPTHSPQRWGGLLGPKMLELMTSQFPSNTDTPSSCWVRRVESSKDMLAASQFSLGSVSKKARSSGKAHSQAVSLRQVLAWTGFEKNSDLREKVGLSLPQLPAYLSWTSHSFCPNQML